MTVRRLHPVQPESFAFTPENLAWAETLVARYPEDKQESAVIPLLWRAQEQHDGWTPEPAIRTVADMLDMPYIRVLEVATFYTMFQLSPVGLKAHVQVCGTTPCMLRGAEDLKAVCRKRIAAQPFALSEDGAFSWEEVECLGVCVNAPLVQVGKDTYEDLTGERLEELLDAFERGERPEPGPQNGRQYSAPEAGQTTLLIDPTTIERWDGGGPRGGQAGSDTTASSAPAGTSAPAALADLADDNLDAESEADAIAARLAELPDDASPEEKADAVGARPAGLEAPAGGVADDLKRVKGIGRVNEDKLNEIGIFHFKQIAAWMRPRNPLGDNLSRISGTH